MKPLLTLTPEEMRRAGYAVIDRLVAHYQSLPEQSPWGEGEAPAPNPFLGPPPPEGSAFKDVMARLDRDLFPYSVRVNHPRFYAFIPGPSNYVGVLGDALAAGFNIFNGTWMGSSGGAELERATIDWVRAALGFPETSGGLFTSGGSMANVIGLAAARQKKLGFDLNGARIYASPETHNSVEKAARLIGFAPEQFRKVAVDDRLRLDVDALKKAIADDRKAGFKPFCVVATPGATNTGAVDPLDDIADLCAAEDLWLHADGAYGACAAFSARGREAITGVERCHSVSFDPHKWLFQPFEIGGVLVREADDLHHVFDVGASYLRDTRGQGRGINYGEYGPQLTRTLRALKLWMTFQIFGADEIARAINHGFEMAELAETLISQKADWRVISPASMGIVAFRAAPDGWGDEDCDRLNAEIAASLKAEGKDMVATTEINDRVALRLCPINPRLTESDMNGTIERLDSCARAAMASWPPSDDTR